MSLVSRRTILKTIGAGGVLLTVGVQATGAQMGGQQDTAFFRVGHFSPNTLPVDVLINDEPFEELQNVPYGSLSPYFAVPADDYNIKVVVAGAMIDGNETTTETEAPMAITDTMIPAEGGLVVIDEDLTLQSNTAYSIFVAEEFENITPYGYEDDNKPASGTEAKVSIGHFSPDATAVDISLVDGPDIVTGVEFGEVTLYSVLDAGTYDVEILASETQEVVKKLSDVEFAGGQVYSVFAIGYATPEGPDLPGLSVLESNDSEAAAMAEGETTTSETPTPTE